jgi:hypothetical protein
MRDEAALAGQVHVRRESATSFSGWRARGLPTQDGSFGALCEFVQTRFNDFVAECTQICENVWFGGANQRSMSRLGAATLQGRCYTR